MARHTGVSEMRKKFARAALGTALVCSTVVVAPSAQAAAQDGNCQVGEFCLYFNSNRAGSIVDMSGGHTDYGSGSGCVKWVNGSQAGRCVKNNAASAWNREAAAVTVFYKSNWSGAIDSIVADDWANLTKTKNENAGHVVGDPANSRLGGALYPGGGGRITSYFDGYLNTAGRHEGIDIAKSVGAPVRALIDGRVTRVTEGFAGRDGLSQIAVYNATFDKTIVYLHTNPSVSVGANVSRGATIGTESWRGITLEANAHTHVEMRLGNRTGAADSTDDPVLDNPIPTEFWMNRGYNICCT